MAASNVDDLKSIASPLDLSLKVVNSTKIINDEVDCVNLKLSDDHKSVTSEELLSLKLLHDRLSKTMELLLPSEKLKQCEEIKGSQTPTSTTDKTSLEFDYRSTMKALLSLMETENVISNDEENKNINFYPNKVQAPHVDTWSYWHDYILSLYLMNPSLSSSLPAMPPIPPPQIPPPIPPPFNFLAPSPNSMLFQSMLNNLISRSSLKSQEENGSKNFLLQENLNQDFGYKNKKINSYQFLKDSSLLYNSFATSRNLGLAKTKLLDSPESFGVSLRGNQKYSIYYQQRPNNIFNNNFLSPTCSSSLSTKLNHNSNYKHSLLNNSHPLNDSHIRKSHVSVDTGYKKSILANNNLNKVHKLTGKDSTGENSKNNSEKIPKLSNFEQRQYNSNFSNIGNDNGNNTIYDNVPANIQLCPRQRETVFNCSCGQEFENLYSFTIHMKSTHHSPNSSKIERSIPKLVRGQDMWINSETEQTKEILRCMRCHQSFRTLPELTMHMVETNHYSEIVYSDTGKCVFLNSDNMKVKPSYTTISSPMSSPGNIIRKMKRTFSSSTCSEIGPEEDNSKRLKISSPLESPKDSIKETLTETETTEQSDIKMECVDKAKCEETLQIIEADSGTVDAQPDSESQSKSKNFKMFDFKDSMINSTNSCDSVIRQIENFVEKSLPKPLPTEYNASSSVFCSTTSSHKTGKSATKCVTTKSSNPDRAWKLDLKTLIHDKPDSFSKHKEKVNDAGSTFDLKNYPISSSDNVENPLSSLQTLVETIQKNTNLVKDPGVNNFKVSTTLNKDSSSYSYPSKSPVVCDSLSQLQALVAGTSMNNIVNHSGLTSSKPQELKHMGYPFSERSKLFASNDIADSSATFLSWCHKLGELLGLPQALSQAMLTQDAIKDLTNSVLMMGRNNQQSYGTGNDTEEDCSSSSNNIATNHTSELANEKPCPTSNSDIKSFPSRDSDPLEQLKNLLNSTSDNGPSNHSHIQSNKFLNGPNQHSNSPPALSKKAKCHFCNKPFANKGQVRLHISKGKCSSLMRSSHSNYSQLESQNNRNLSPINYDLNCPAIYKFKETIANDNSGKGDIDTNFNNNSKDNSTMTSKSVNLIREYFQFAKQMIAGNDDCKGSSPRKIENKSE